MKPRTIILGLIIAGSMTLMAQEKKAVGSQPVVASVSASEVPQKKATRKLNPVHASAIERNRVSMIDRESPGNANKDLTSSNQVTAEVKAFPNPFTTQIDIIITEGGISKSDYRATLYDVTGKKVHSEVLTANQSSLELSQLSKGIYFLHVEKNGLLIKSEKFVKE